MSLPLPSKGAWLDRIPIPAANSHGKLPILITASLFILVLVSLTFLQNRSKYPLVNGPSWFQLRLFKQLDFIQNGMEIFERSRKRFAGKPFRMLTEVGEVIVLPPSYAHDIRNEPGLSFGKAIAQDFHANVPGFEPFGIGDHGGQIAQTVIRKQLTKSLNTVTEPLSSETTFATHLLFGDSNEWKEVFIKDRILDLISRLSSRVFLGDEVCRNEAWLKVTKGYTVDAFKAAIKMMMLPTVLKPFGRWLFSPDCKRVRQQYIQTREIIAPILEKRRALKAKAMTAGKPIPVFNDAIDWAESESNGQHYDAAVFQLLLSFAAIHTTSELTCEVLLLLANEPKLMTPLREEMINTLRVEGWKKSALFQMKLLDSAIKEAQRIKPNVLLSMRRLATKDIPLPDGGVIRKGERTFVDASKMLSPELHQNPEKFDIYRFLNMREEPGLANMAQLVSTSPDHLAFGYGMHACPGRFFASNELKIALCHLLLKYDWKLAPGTTVKPITRAVILSVNPEAKLLYRRRKEEIDLESLEFV